MSRLSALAAHPRRTIGALAVVLAAVGITVGSGASFTARAANPANTFTAGTLSIDNSQGNGAAASAILSAGAMKPGDTAPGIVDIENTGSVAGRFTLKTSSAQDSNPSILGQLDIKIEDCGAYPSDGSVPACGSGRTLTATGAKVKTIGTIDLGSFAASEKHRYKFYVTLPSDTDDTYQGKSGSISFDWDATTA